VTTKPIAGLADFKLAPTDDPNTRVMLAADTVGRRASFLVNPEGLGVVLQQALLSAVAWADEPELDLRTLAGPQHPLSASAIAFDVASETEIAVRLWIGKVEITFLIPLDDAVNAMGSLVSRVDPESGSAPH